MIQENCDDFLFANIETNSGSRTPTNHQSEHGSSENGQIPLSPTSKVNGLEKQLYDKRQEICEQQNELKTAALLGQGLLEKNGQLQQDFDAVLEDYKAQHDLLNQARYELERKTEYLVQLGVTDQDFLSNPSELSFDGNGTAIYPLRKHNSTLSEDIMRQKLKDLELDNEELKDERKDLQQINDQLSDKLRMISKRFHEDQNYADSRTKDLETKLEMITAEGTDVESKLQQMIEELVESQRMRNALVEENEELRVGLEQSQEKELILAKENREMQETYQESIFELQRANEERRDLREQLKRMQAEKIFVNDTIIKNSEERRSSIGRQSWNDNTDMNTSNTLQLTPNSKKPSNSITARKLSSNTSSLKSDAFKTDKPSSESNKNTSKTENFETTKNLESKKLNPKLTSQHSIRSSATNASNSTFTRAQNEFQKGRRGFANLANELQGGNHSTPVKGSGRHDVNYSVTETPTTANFKPPHVSTPVNFGMGQGDKSDFRNDFRNEMRNNYMGDSQSCSSECDGDADSVVQAKREHVRRRIDRSPDKSTRETRKSRISSGNQQNSRNVAKSVDIEMINHQNSKSNSDRLKIEMNSGSASTKPRRVKLEDYQQKTTNFAKPEFINTESQDDQTLKIEQAQFSQWNSMTQSEKRNQMRKTQSSGVLDIVMRCSREYEDRIENPRNLPGPMITQHSFYRSRHRLLSDISGSHSSLTGSEAITEVATIVSLDHNKRPLGQPGIPGTDDLDNTVNERTEKHDNYQQKLLNPNSSFIITEIEIDETTRQRARTRARTIDSQYLTVNNQSVGGIRQVNSAIRLVKEVAGSDMLGNWQHKANEVLLSGLETIQDYNENPNAPKFQIGEPPIFQAGSSNDSSNCSTPTPEKHPDSRDFRDSNSPMVNRTPLLRKGENIINVAKKNEQPRRKTETPPNSPKKNLANVHPFAKHSFFMNTPPRRYEPPPYTFKELMQMNTNRIGVYPALSRPKNYISSSFSPKYPNTK